MTHDKFADDFTFTTKPDRPGPALDGEPDPFEATIEGIAGLPAEVDRDWFERYAEKPTWRQRGRECTGFALAGAVNHLVRSRGFPDAPSMSPRMMYEMAQEYDRAAYTEGSTLRGALIGWERRGVTTQELWPYDPDDEDGRVHGGVTLARLNDARTRQLSSMSYRGIPPSEIELMKAALAEHKVLYVVAEIHTGWFRPYMPDPDDDADNITVIDQIAGDTSKGHHAFLIVGYSDQREQGGFWIHNSWGEHWGDGGYAFLTYADWRANGSDVWVIDIDQRAEWPKPALAERAGADISLADQAATARTMWRHVVALGDDGRLGTEGLYACDDDQLKNLFYLVKQAIKDWETPRLAVIVDDGASPRADTIERLRSLRDRLMAEQIYPIFVVWDVPWLPDLDDELTLPGFGTADERERENIGTSDAPDIVDISYWFYEYVAPQGMGVMMWRAIRDRADLAAARPDGGLRLLAERIRFRWNDAPFDLHLAAHGAGDFGLSELTSLLEVPIASCDLLGPATTIDQFERTYGPKLDDGRLHQMTITVLDDVSERADHIGNYQESILCLAANVLAVDDIDSPERFHYGPLSEAPETPMGAMEQEQWRHKLHRDPEPIVGLERFLTKSGLAGRADIEVVAGLTHRGLSTDAGVVDATIDRMKQTQSPSGTPRPPEAQAPSHDGDPLVVAERGWRSGGRPDSGGDHAQRVERGEPVDPLIRAHSEYLRRSAAPR